MSYNADPGTNACLSGSYNDRDDLDALAPEQLAVLAGLLGTRTTVRAVLARGQKTWKAWQKTRPNSQVALMTPLLLSAILRAGASR